MTPKGIFMAGSQRLSHLLKLADQGPTLRAALAEEVAELLSQWPEEYPQSMRRICEVLLAKTARDVDPATRVLPRESAVQSLIEAARMGEHLTWALSQSLGVDDKMAEQILEDETGAALAVACKGANIERAAFSALALLVKPGRDRAQAFAVLEAYDNVPLSEAARLLRSWRNDELPMRASA
jgi:Uncharacterised protein conserved in bacteria (DUF2336)